ncbi:MAG: hypothetical protein A2X08_06295 [Bacteroidetes bacterium GWA2_32_17]|nr:MAG: hypothetical protein A2X08_06295 [Bacteroidetes bacterium GWA2_32_17]
MTNSKITITDKEREKAEKQIKELNIPYDYNTLEYPIEVLLYKFKTGVIKDGASIYIPNYQRNFVWNEYEMSRFIESLFLGVPIQPIFASINDNSGYIEIIDGSQRIRTIDAFVNHGLVLQDLKKLTTLNGFSYLDLDLSRQNKFQTNSLRFQIISDKATEEIKQDIFYRLNTSGRKASPAEVRKGSFGGKFYDFIIECSENKLFKKLTPLSKDKIKRGDAQELVLRFFTYSEFGEDPKIRGQKYLDKYVEEKNKNGFDKHTLQNNFITMLEFVEKYIPNGFSKSSASDSTPRVRFEAISVGSFLALQYDPTLKPTYIDWLDSVEFDDHVASDGSNNSGRLTKRVNFVRDSLLNRIKKDQLHYGKI